MQGFSQRQFLKYAANHTPPHFLLHHRQKHIVLVLWFISNTKKTTNFFWFRSVIQLHTDFLNSVFHFICRGIDNLQTTSKREKLIISAHIKEMWFEDALWDSFSRRVCRGDITVSARTGGIVVSVGSTQLYPLWWKSQGECGSYFYHPCWAQVWGSLL